MLNNKECVGVKLAGFFKFPVHFPALSGSSKCLLQCSTNKQRQEQNKTSNILTNLSERGVHPSDYIFMSKSLWCFVIVSLIGLMCFCLKGQKEAGQ